MQLSIKKISLIILMSSAFSCVHTRPHLDIAATKTAIEYMNKAGAVKKAPRLFKQSMQYYARATKLLEQKNNISAQKYLHLARTYAEKAEFRSRTKINKNQKEW